MRTPVSQAGVLTAFLVLVAGMIVVPSSTALAAPGEPDAAFNTTMDRNFPQGDTYIDTIAVQPDGKIVAGGDYENTPVGTNLSRFWPDGSPDVAFNAAVQALGIDSTVWSVAVQPDGKILAGGSFRTVGPRLIRLNPDGTLDGTFANNVAGLIDGGVWDVRVQSDDKILIGGAFTSPGRYLARLNSDGTPDNAFNTTVGLTFNDWVQETEILPDGSIVAVGPFTTPTSRVAKLLPNGQLDVDFNNNAGALLNGQAQSVAVQPDGKLLIAGNFRAPVPTLVRLAANGIPDRSFNDAVADALTQVGFGLHVIVTERRILLGGAFGVRGPESETRLLGFTNQGRADSAFNGRVADVVPESQVQWLTQQVDGKILIGGGEGPGQVLVRVDGGPVAPTSFKVKAKTGGKMVLKWTASPSQTIDSYVVKIKKERSGAKIKNVGNVLRKTYMNVKPGKRVCYRVAAVDSSGERSGWTTKKCVTSRL